MQTLICGIVKMCTAGSLAGSGDSLTFFYTHTHTLSSLLYVSPFTQCKASTGGNVSDSSPGSAEGGQG